jgi:selenocysteine-specific elongation factor
MHVVATAGHVDHGKSTLVRALTGMEPDRWAEERRRGLTIDLGYAWTSLPSGDSVAFVDVPGHSRFIGNMLAGLGPAPSVMFVVAADEGWRAQSTEHLAAVDALGLTSGVLVVTRSDLADPAPAMAEASEHIASSSLGHIEAVAVSGTTGAGIDALGGALQGLVDAAPEPDVEGPVRLWVDRAFVMKGSGTVVTGTLGAGTLRVGDEMQLGSRRVRIRGLQSLGTAYGDVPAVARVAVNLRAVEHGDVRRGDTLLSVGSWPLTGTVDVRVTADVSREAVLHVGTAAVPVRARRLGEDTGRLTLRLPLPLQIGDRGVLRDGTGRIAAGVRVIETAPQLRRRRRTAPEPPADVALAPGVEELAERLASRPFAAPERAELDALGLGRRELDAAVAAGRLLRLPSVVVLLPDAPRRAVQLLSELPQPFAPSDARQAWDTSRRVAIPLLEHLDGRGWTRRVDGSLREVVR